MKTLLLTGGTGYIGSHCAVSLLDEGYSIIIIDNLSNSSEEVIHKIESITGKTPLFYKGDIRNRELLQQIFSENDIDSVLHFAGLKSVGESCHNPYEYYENNITGTLALLETMDEYKVKNIVFSSSATVYNPRETPPFIEDTPTGNTTNPYGTTKFLIENILRDLAQHKNFKVANLRYFNPIGAHESGLIGEDPNDIPNNLLPYIMKVAAGELSELSVFGDDYDTPDGTGIRDYIHVVDLSQGHIAALKWLEKTPPPANAGIPLNEWEQIGMYENFNLGTGHGTSVLEMIRYTEEIIGSKLAHTITQRRAGDIASAYCSPLKAEKILGWKAEKTVQEAIQDSWNFIIQK